MCLGPGHRDTGYAFSHLSLQEFFAALHLLASPQHGRWDPEELARQLWEAGHEAEAGSLLLAARGTHRALRTFSTALGAAQHWV